MATVRYNTIDGEIVAEKRAGVRKTYVPDPLGSTVALLDSQQQKTDTFRYWPFGEEAYRSGNTPAAFRFEGTIGYRSNDRSGIYVRARWLSQHYSRWTSRDPLRSSWSQPSLYAYCDDNPAKWTDASGLIKHQCANEHEKEDCSTKYKDCLTKCPYPIKSGQPVFVAADFLGDPLNDALQALLKKRGPCTKRNSAWATSGPCYLLKHPCNGTHTIYNCRGGYDTSIVCCPFCVDAGDYLGPILLSCCSFSTSHAMP